MGDLSKARDLTVRMAHLLEGEALGDVMVAVTLLASYGIHQGVRTGRGTREELLAMFMRALGVQIEEDETNG